MKQTKYSVLLMVVTVAIPVLTRIFAQNVYVLMQMRIFLIHLLEMVTARMELIMLNVTMMEGIVVVHVSLPAFAQIALASKIALTIQFFIKELEMDTVMMKPITLPVILTMETVV